MSTELGSGLESERAEQAGHPGRDRAVLYVVLITLALLGVLEGAARVVEQWTPPLDVDLGLGFDPDTRVFVPSPDDPAVLTTHPAKRQAFREQRFRAAKEEGEFRAFALGGSSVNYLGDGLLGLDGRLGAAFSGRYDRVEIINVGGLTYGSQRIVPIAAEVLKYEPDLILLYSGHNEFEELEQMEFVDLEGLPWQRRLSHLALFRLIRDRKARWTMRQLEREHNQAVMAHSDVDYLKVWQHTFSPGEVEERMRSFRRNLVMIAQMCKARSVPLIVGTVPSNLLKPSLTAESAPGFEPARALYAEGRYAEGLAATRRFLRSVPRHQASDAENEIIRAVAEEYGLTLADVETAICAAEPHGVPGETLFSDECHLNLEGNLILIDVFERAIQRRYGLE